MVLIILGTILGSWIIASLFGIDDKSKFNLFYWLSLRG